MPEIDYPGVYVEEDPSGVAPIVGVETSTTGFVGEVGSAERCAAVQVRSVAEFERAFRRVESGFELGATVAQFFANGGNDAWVVGLPNGVPLSDGLQRFDGVDTLSLLCLPGETDVDVLRAAIEYAECRRAFMLIDPPGTDIATTIALTESLGLGGSANGAVYFPSLQVDDPAGVLSTCPPSGAVAGMYARVDRSRGVWKAPAGEESVLHGAVAPALDLSDDEMSRLTSAAVNAIRGLPGGGVAVLGARTIQGADQSDSVWKYVPVRRLDIFVEHSIDRGTQWAVFEPNDEATWAKVRRQCVVFLEGLFRQGALQGRTSDEAYFVRCGSDTMTQNDIDNGRLNLVIGIAPLKPAEFVIFRIGQWRDESSTDSLDASGNPDERLCLRHHPVADEGVFLQVADDGAWTTWTEVPDLGEAGPDDRVYSLDVESGELTFGDGVHGARLPSGRQNVRATYRHGAGGRSRCGRAG